MLLTTLFYCFHNTGTRIRLMVQDCVNSIEQRILCIKYGSSGYSWASQVGHCVKNLPAMQETQEVWVWFLGLKDPLEEGMVTHSSILAWRIPCGGAGRAIVYRVAKSWTWLKRLSMHVHLLIWLGWLFGAGGLFPRCEVWGLLFLAACGLFSALSSCCRRGL